MLDRLFTAHYAAPRLRSSPLGQWLDSFVERLDGLGYTAGSCRSYVVLAADLGRWMADSDLSVGELDESAIGSYVEHRRTDPDRRRWAAARMLEHLRAEGAAPPRRSDAATGATARSFTRGFAGFGNRRSIATTSTLSCSVLSKSTSGQTGGAGEGLTWNSELGVRAQAGEAVALYLSVLDIAHNPTLERRFVSVGELAGNFRGPLGEL